MENSYLYRNCLASVVFTCNHPKTTRCSDCPNSDIQNSNGFCCIVSCFAKVHVVRGDGEVETELLNMSQARSQNTMTCREVNGIISSIQGEELLFRLSTGNDCASCEGHGHAMGLASSTEWSQVWCGVLLGPKLSKLDASREGAPEPWLDRTLLHICPTVCTSGPFWVWVCVLETRNPKPISHICPINPKSLRAFIESCQEHSSRTSL